VTIRDLLCHRTGMPRHDMLWAGLTTDSEELIRRWGKAKHSTSFRSTWEYSNVPFTTAGVIGGKYEKTDWAGATKKRIFDPLGMTNTSGRVKDALANPDHATPHYLRLDKSVIPIAWDDIDFCGGAGNVSSCARDLGQWLRFQVNQGAIGDRRLLKRDALKETHTQQMLFRAEGPWLPYFPPDVTRFTGYGLGWFVTDYRGFTCLSHGGTLGGFRSQCMILPEAKVGVFVLCNVRPSLFPDAIGKMLLDLTLGAGGDWVKRNRTAQAAFDFDIAVAKKKRDNARRADSTPSRELKAYAGKYDEPAYGRASVSLDDGKLKVAWGRYAFRLDHYHFDTFTAIPVEVPADTSVAQFDRSTFEVQFRLATNGDVETLQFLGQDFKRTKP
jgi:CubicO group peptidase (beta-lactamase class C family)